MLNYKIIHILAKIGGWFGLAFGASIISFIEMAYFVITLCFGTKINA